MYYFEDDNWCELHDEPYRFDDRTGYPACSRCGCSLMEENTAYILGDRAVCPGCLLDIFQGYIDCGDDGGLAELARIESADPEDLA